MFSPSFSSSVSSILLLSTLFNEFSSHTCKRIYRYIYIPYIFIVYSVIYYTGRLRFLFTQENQKHVLKFSHVFIHSYTFIRTCMYRRCVNVACRLVVHLMYARSSQHVKICSHNNNNISLLFCGFRTQDSSLKTVLYFTR